MHEGGADPAVEHTPQQPGDEGGLRTGVPAVDDVLAELDALDTRPVEEHVAVFERAHDTLRRALDAPGGNT